MDATRSRQEKEDAFSVPLSEVEIFWFLPERAEIHLILSTILSTPHSLALSRIATYTFLAANYNVTRILFRSFVSSHLVSRTSSVPAMQEPSEPQFSVFKDCIAQRLLHISESTGTADVETQVSGSGPESSQSGLDDFASYLAIEAWPIIPTVLQNADYETREAIPDPSTVSLDSISTAFVDSLVSYGVVQDSEDALVFLKKTIDSYFEQACAPPPVWSSTRTEECAICGREVPLTYHHLIPRSVHTKVLKKGWHPKSMLNSVAWLCR